MRLVKVGMDLLASGGRSLCLWVVLMVVMVGMGETLLLRLMLRLITCGYLSRKVIIGQLTVRLAVVKKSMVKGGKTGN